MPQRPSPPELLSVWTNVDRYYEATVGADDPVLSAALEASRRAGLPDIQVSPLQGKLLYLLATAVNARRILEIGTLGGYSTLWLARALPLEGRLVTLEVDRAHADIAQSNLARGGLADRVEVRVGPALESLPKLAEGEEGPFDLVFIDADKREYPEYLDWALRLARPGALILADNVVRRGDVVVESGEDESVLGVRRMNERVAHDPRLSATVVQTVGSKGYDGMMVAVVRGNPSRSVGAGARGRPPRGNANKRRPLPARVRSVRE